MSSRDSFIPIVQTQIEILNWKRINSGKNSTSHHYAYFAQFDWLKKKKYTSINSMSRIVETIFFPPDLKMCNFKLFMTQLELYGMNY